MTGTLKGYDALMNLVLDEVQEAVRGTFACGFGVLGVSERGANMRETDDEGNETTRSLGLVVVRGTLLVVISPVDGSEVIANPFLQQEEMED